MKRLLLLTLLTLTACSSPAGKPQYTENQPSGYSVTKLTTFDGCTVYRLNGDGLPIYWTKCANAAPSQTQTHVSVKPPITQSVPTNPQAGDE